MSAWHSLPSWGRARVRREYRNRTYIPRWREAYGQRQAWAPAEHRVFPASYWRGTSRVVEQPMPKGGVRLMVRCPGCGEPRRRLYLHIFEGAHFLCRTCLGLRYASQYGYEEEGKRQRNVQQRRMEFERRHALALALAMERRLTGMLREYRRMFVSWLRWCDPVTQPERYADIIDLSTTTIQGCMEEVAELRELRATLRTADTATVKQAGMELRVLLMAA